MALVGSADAVDEGVDAGDEAQVPFGFAVPAAALGVVGQGLSVVALCGEDGQVRGGGVVGLPPFDGHRLGGLRRGGCVPVLEGYRADVAKSAVAPAAVVHGLDPLAHGADCLGAGGEAVTVVELGFQRRPETLLLRVVPAHPGPPDRQSDPDLDGDVVQLL